MYNPAAREDYLAPRVPDAEARRVKTLFIEKFSVDELCEAIVGDINQQAVGLQRYIDRDALALWVSTEGAAKGMDPHSIYFSDELGHTYNDARPSPENMYQPFINKVVAFNLLCALFL
jgi:hypothetical protein